MMALLCNGKTPSLRNAKNAHFASKKVNPVLGSTLSCQRYQICSAGAGWRKPQKGHAGRDGGHLQAAHRTEIAP